jgi:hypothetical protein
MGCYIGLSQFFEVNDMQDDFHSGAPECRVWRKVNKNRLLEEENLAFVGCVVVGAAVVDDDIVELLS